MSLRVRITLLLSGLTALIVIIAGFTIHQLTQADIRKSIDEKLTVQLSEVSETPVLVSVIQTQRFFSNLNRRNSNDPSFVERRLDIEIPTFIKSQDDIILATEGYPDFSGIIVPYGFSDIETDGAKWRVLTKTMEVIDFSAIRNIHSAINSGRISYERGMEQLANSDKVNYEILVQAAVKRTSINTTLQDLKQRLVLVGILAVIVSAIAGWLLGTTLLKPLARLARHAQVVTNSADLSNRVEDTYGPPEVETLALEINEMLSRLELSAHATDEALRSSRAFTSNVAHELRTPLTSMRTNLDLLKIHTDMDTSERIQVLNNLVLEHERLLSTLESLRLLARGDLSEAGIFEEIDFAQLIAAIISDQQKIDPECVIKLELPSNPPLLSAWRQGMTLLFRNVIENAQIHSRSSNQKGVQIDIFVEVINQDLKVVIDDNGPGIPQSERKQVIERFIRGSNASTVGSGLGLALVSQQSAIHGGSIELEESPTGGTRAVIILPVVIS